VGPQTTPGPLHDLEGGEGALQIAEVRRERDPAQQDSGARRQASLAGDVGREREQERDDDEP
jgi:hypothetical protein